MNEILENELKIIAKIYGISYEKVLKLANLEVMPTKSEYPICCKIQSVKAKLFLKEEFGIDITQPQTPRQGQGFIYMPLKLSRKTVIR